MTSQTVEETQTKPETYVPKMKPGDVEIPNRVFVKGFPRESTADDLFAFFEDYGKVLECRIVADRYGCSKGFGFVTFDSQIVAEKVKTMERIQYNDEIELVIGPARIRKKRFYLVQAPWNPQPQPFYAPDGSVVWATSVPQSPVAPQSPQMVSAVSMVPQQQSYPTPVILSVVNDSPNYKQPATCLTYQTTSPQNYNVIEKVAIPTVTSPVCVDDSQQVPCISPTPSTYMNPTPTTYMSSTPTTYMSHTPTTYVDVQPAMNVPEAIVYNPMVSLVTQKMCSLQV